MVLSNDLFYGFDDEYSLDFDKEFEKKDEDMADQDLDQMTQGPLTLFCILDKMSRHSENLLTKYDLEKSIKLEDHLENFYLHLQTLEVGHDDVACRLFPCTLEGRAVVWYHSLQKILVGTNR